MNEPFRYAADKLAELAGPDLWPLAMVYFNPKTRGLQAAVLPTGAELIVGHGRKIGVTIEAQARALCKIHGPTSGTARPIRSSSSAEPPSPPPAAGPAGAA